MSENHQQQQSGADKLVKRPTSIVVFEAGGSSYPMRSVKNCKVCRSPDRYEIETAVVAGGGFTAIARSFPDSEVTGQGISNHFRKQHVPLLQAAVDKHKRLHDEHIDKLVAKSNDELVAEIELSRRLVQSVAQKVLTGEMDPSFSDAIRAAEFLMKAEQMHEQASERTNPDENRAKVIEWAKIRYFGQENPCDDPACPACGSTTLR